MANSKDNVIITSGIKDKLFPANWELLPNSHEMWDWEMAYLEMLTLGKKQLLDRSAFFARIDGSETFHYRMCNNIDSKVHSGKSIFTRSFFLAHQYSTGYATHSLFPYRGKFHPQLIKGLLNILRIEPDDVILDPMAGSCTACVEAQIMGIKSIGIDISPFCGIMGKAKTFATTMNIEAIERLEALFPDIQNLFNKKIKGNLTGLSLKKLFSDRAIDLNEAEGFYNLSLLAYLDAVGYARRTKGNSANDLFSNVFNRYLLTIRAFASFWKANAADMDFGNASVQVGSAGNLELLNESVDCIITSPPYSFAIDYAENDAPQLELIGVDVANLKQQMIGLRGDSKKTRIQNYFQDMSVVFREMGRVLKNGKYCVVIIGSNSLQTDGIRHDEEFKQFAPSSNLIFVRDIVKPIKGIQNSLHEEHLMFFRKK